MTSTSFALTTQMFAEHAGHIRDSDIAAIIAIASSLAGDQGWRYLEVDLEREPDRPPTAALRGVTGRSWIAVRAGCQDPASGSTAAATTTANAVPLSRVDHIDQVADQPAAPVRGVEGAWRLRFVDGVAHTIGRHLNERRDGDQFTRTAFGDLSAAVTAVTARW